VLTCPFCGAAESDRFVLEETRFIVFPCAFTAEVPAPLPEEALPERLATQYAGPGDPYFRRTCDSLHRYVTRGPGAAILTRPGPSSPE
jgi:hypothetical protein